MPQIHYDLSGHPIAFIRNFSKLEGEFSLIKIDVTSIWLFPCIKDKVTMDNALTHGDEFPKELLSSTDWVDFTDVGTLLPYFFITYFGHQLAYGDLSDNNFMAKLPCLGFGYKLWANIAKDALKTLVDILTIMEDVKTPEKIKKYFDPTWDKNKSLPLASFKRPFNTHTPFGTMTIVQSNDYPVATRAINDLFQLLQQVPRTLEFTPNGNSMLQLPGEIDKESEAKKGIIKLMLLHICGNTDIDSVLITNVNLDLANPSRGMQIVFNQLHAARACQFADQVWMTLDLAKQQDYINICSSQVSIQVMLKVLASHILEENFATEKVTSLELKANSIEPSAFLPQKNACLVEHEKNNKVKVTLENVVDLFSDSHKTKGKTAISCIGTMTSMTDFSTLSSP